MTEFVIVLFAIAVISTVVLCFSVAIFSAWIVSIGIARDEGREKLALCLLVSGVVLPPVNWVFLLRHGRYRKAPWIGKFLLVGVAALAVGLVSLLAMKGLSR